MATLQELETALVNAHKAGDVNAARTLAAAVNKERERRVSTPEGSSQSLIEQIPDGQNFQVPGTVPEKQEPSMSDEVVGLGEAGLTMLTGGTAGMVGMVGGALKAIAQQMLSGEFGQNPKAVERAAQEGAQALTYAPRTAEGQENVEAVGDVLSLFPPVVPALPQLPAASAGARSGVVASRQVVQSGAQTAKQLAQQAYQAIPENLKESASTRVQAVRDKLTPAPKVQPGSAGAAGTGQANVREQLAGELPVPIKLTKGDKTRDFAQQQFEREIAKNPEIGEPIRQRRAEQNLKIQQNLDSFIDETGSEITTLRGVGEIVDESLRKRAARDKTQIRALYKEAEKSGEMAQPANLSEVANYLNKNRAARSENGIMTKTQRQLDTLEVSNGSFENGSLQLRPLTLGQAEALRRFINKNVNKTDSNDIRVASELKDLIDGATERLGGNKYKAARAARARYANNYENIGLIDDLLRTKKGTTDRAVALEDVLRKSVLESSTSLDTLKQMRRLLQTEGETGKQAWKEIQGNTLRYIQDKALQSVSTDSQGNRMVSATQLSKAVNQLDRSGKLEFLYGKKGAEMLRILTEVAADIMTAPPGSVNSSNTASMLAAFADLALSAGSGIPAPLATTIRIGSKQIKDRKLKARVKDALGE